MAVLSTFHKVYNIYHNPLVSSGCGTDLGMLTKPWSVIHEVQFMNPVVQLCHRATMECFLLEHVNTIHAGIPSPETEQLQMIDCLSQFKPHLSLYLILYTVCRLLCLSPSWALVFSSHFFFEYQVWSFCHGRHRFTPLLCITLTSALDFCRSLTLAQERAPLHIVQLSKSPTLITW